MKKFCLNLKSSDKITFFFTGFNFISLVILLIWVNIIYFFAWYSDQKAESMYDMDINYDMYNSQKSDNNLEAFKEYILKKDTLIIPIDGGELICSNWVETRIHSDVEKIKDKLFYNSWEKIFFIFTQYYDDIWEVKVFFDTTPYVKSQLLIIKISIIIILFLIIIYYFIARIMTKKAFKNMRQFTTDVSHEFKTPLMVIDSQIDLYNKKLEKKKISWNDTNLLLTKVKENTYKLNNLLETFLLLSRLENSLQCLNTQEIDFEEYIKKLVSNSGLLNEKKLKIDYNIFKKTKLKIENNTFNILFENILSNAIKFSKLWWKIEIWSNKTSFWIKDNWVWIEKAKLKKIWKKFYKNDTNKEWFWVGLFIVKRLCELYNWKIEVKSEPWKGTVFIIKFK